MDADARRLVDVVRRLGRDACLETARALLREAAHGLPVEGTWDVIGPVLVAQGSLRGQPVPRGAWEIRALFGSLDAPLRCELSILSGQDDRLEHVGTDRRGLRAVDAVVDLTVRRASLTWTEALDLTPRDPSEVEVVPRLRPGELEVDPMAPPPGTARTRRRPPCAACGGRGEVQHPHNGDWVPCGCDPCEVCGGGGVYLPSGEPCRACGPGAIDR